MHYFMSAHSPISLCYRALVLTFHGLARHTKQPRLAPYTFASSSSSLTEGARGEALTELLVRALWSFGTRSFVIGTQTTQNRMLCVTQ